MALVFTFASIAFFCEFGERVTDQFDLFNAKLCHCDWYLFPIEMQRIYFFVLLGIQHPIVVRGFANTLCTRTAFKNVNSSLF